MIPSEPMNEARKLPAGRCGTGAAEGPANAEKFSSEIIGGKIHPIKREKKEKKAALKRRFAASHRAATI